MTTTDIPGRTGALLCRFVVPLWIALGATVKLIERSPATLPSVIVKLGAAVGFDLTFLLRYLIGVELVAVGLMLLMPRAARTVAAFMLTVFCLILVAEMTVGAGSCGCFGSVTVQPWAMFAADATLLVGVLFLRPRRRPFVAPGGVSAARLFVVLVWILASFALAVLVPPRARVELERTQQAAPAATPSPAEGREPAAVPPQGAEAAAAAEPATGSAPSPTATTTLLPDYVLPDLGTWIGKRWDELEMSSYLDEQPPDWRSGRRYLVFYRRDCPHCHDLLATYFLPPLIYPTTLIAVPEREGFPTTNVFPQPCTTCTEVELPAGTDWLIQTPAVVVLQDGVVECAAEVDPAAPECIEW